MLHIDLIFMLFKNPTEVRFSANLSNHRCGIGIKSDKILKIHGHAGVGTTPKWEYLTIPGLGSDLCPGKGITGRDQSCDVSYPHPGGASL